MTRALTEDEISTLGGQSRWNLTPADPLGTTVPRISGTGRDRLVIRNRFTFDLKMEPKEGWLQQVTQDHDHAFAARFPMLNNVSMEHRWGGRLCPSRNNVRVVQELEQGVFAACCQNGLGTAKGTHAGMLAAEATCGLGTDVLRRALDCALPTRLPPAPLARLGASTKLR